MTCLKHIINMSCIHVDMICDILTKLSILCICTYTYVYVYIYSMPYTQYITTLYYDQTPNKYIQSACCNPIVFDNVSMKFGIGIRSTGLVLPR